MCTGAIAGLVGITPAAGYVPVYTSIIFGVVPAIICNLAVDLKLILQIDDGMDVFALHGVGGFCGSFLTGLFAADYVAATDGATVIEGGWMNHHWKQLGYQLAGSTSIGAWSFVVTAIILLAMDRVPFLRLRLHEDEELMGVDLAEIGEYAYYNEEEDATGLGPSLSPYVLEPIRSNDPKVARLRNAAQEKAVQGTTVDGEVLSPVESSNNSKK